MWKRASYSWVLSKEKKSFEQFSLLWTYFSTRYFTRGTIHFCKLTRRVFATVEALAETHTALFQWLIALAPNIQVLYEIPIPSPHFYKGVQYIVS